MNDAERAKWLAGLSVGDTVLSCDRYTQRPQQVTYIDHTRIFYGSADCPDWVFRVDGLALSGTSSMRWIEPVRGKG